MTELPRMMAASEVCDRIGIVPMTLNRWLADPDLDFPRPVRVKRFRFWPEPEIAAWLNNRRK